ncbi:metallophosphoesterase [Neobacillus piezotolerans]|uniref:Metallophosphoesterase n=1 Tax=Neobacillus piezotolerans TaxID=2259171 RepID=A0A3D8GQ09_9BACI|nr:metallophosphoesterase [Neobacillus piezotolerans]RDU36580.1 metallophosphoesterase [Neobacillus piezotolerans]
MAWLAFGNNVSVHELEFDDFPDSFGELRIFFISDIHHRLISDSILLAAKGKADIVIIGGDLMEKGVPLERVKANIEKLRTIGPVYFVWGNNDYEGNYRDLDALLLDLKVKILDNTAVMFESAEGGKIALLGVDDAGLKKDRLDYALLDAEQGCFKILASHNPKIIGKIKPDDGISFLLSGHTHGGQIRIFGLGPYQKGGIDKIGGIVRLISNGYGTTGVPLRLGAHSECHLITLKPGKKEKGAQP